MNVTLALLILSLLYFTQADDWKDPKTWTKFIEGREKVSVLKKGGFSTAQIELSGEFIHGNKMFESLKSSIAERETKRKALRGKLPKETYKTIESSLKKAEGVNGVPTAKQDLQGIKTNADNLVTRIDASKNKRKEIKEMFPQIKDQLATLNLDVGKRNGERDELKSEIIQHTKAFKVMKDRLDEIKKAFGSTKKTRDDLKKIADKLGNRLKKDAEDDECNWIFKSWRRIGKYDVHCPSQMFLNKMEIHFSGNFFKHSLHCCSVRIPTK